MILIAFVGSLLFLALAQIVFAPYVAVLLAPFVWKRHRKLKKAAKQEGGAWPLRETFRRLRSMFQKVVIVFLVLHSGFYCWQIIKWAGPDNAHHQAKMYFAAGQVVAGQRKLLTLVLHPDNPVLYPLNKLQRLVFAVGSRFLPPNDGEEGMWRNSWFIYPYSYKFLDPYGTTRKHVHPPMVALLDEAWLSIETAASKPMADHQMYQEYLFSFAHLANYYQLMDAFYLADPKTGIRAERIIKHPIYHAREERLFAWLLPLKAQWQQEPEVWAKIQKRPKIDVARLMALIYLQGHMIQADLFKGKFSCADPQIARYRELRRDFAGDGQTPGAIDLIRDKETRETLYDMTIQNYLSMFLKYALQDYCHQSVSGNFFANEDMKENYFGDVYKEELAVIKKETLQ